MSDLLALFVGIALVNNFVLVQFLGLCPYVGTSQRLETAVPMTLATAFVMILTTLLTHALYNFLLVPLGLEYLRIIAFIFAIASVVQMTELYIRQISPVLHQLLGIYLPLITSNCAILGLALTIAEFPLHEAMIYAIGGAIGFGIVLVAFASLRERLQSEAIPRPFRGTPVALLTAGFMALAFAGFRGMG